ncbi:hypothetical protein B0T24DRAFT_675851 [Lasiosphaeria ovina]|uniref:Uncharacterized protein n=1 Tax=Lasiosphaeria ovina TaxID=92902 RepID=A0AAE0NEQ4_9PEZI|nr:hypothetical protein B0T24DRAFT_675851 [Lasiosphaeria ovina]
MATRSADFGLWVTAPLSGVVGEKRSISAIVPLWPSVPPTGWSGYLSLDLPGGFRIAGKVTCSPTCRSGSRGELHSTTMVPRNRSSVGTGHVALLLYWPNGASR